LKDIFKRPQQERSEFAPIWISPAKSVLFNEVNKKVLGEVLCILAAVSPPANKRINGTTVAPVEALQRVAFFLILARSGYQAPLRGFKSDSLAGG
jgi:hypothetical protein